LQNRLLGAVAAALVVTAVAADTPPANRRNFVSCPIVRDTATVPCWLTEHDGELYYLGIQTDVSADFDPPYLGHQVLVEGTVSDVPRICGGLVLEPVMVSTLPEQDARCNQIWPAEDQYTVPFAPRPPGPSGGRLAFDPPPGAARPAPPPIDPSVPRTFELRYDFDMLIQGRHAPVLGQVLAHAEKVGATRIEVTGYAGATLLSDGTVMSEPDSIALKRAREVAGLLEGAGLDEPTFSVVAGSHDAVPDGIDDWHSRRSVVIVHP
jgi:hypothetical protein